MKSISRFLIISFLFFQPLRVIGFTNADTILYQQKLTRYDITLKIPLRDNRGKIYLTGQQLIFKTKKPKNEFMNFAIPYEQIEKIRRANALIFPNRIKIKTKDGKRYGLGTYRRKKIIEITKQKMKEH